MQFHTYLNFDGTCQEAFEFYAKSLQGTIVMMQTHGDSPMAEHVPPSWHSKVLHAHLAVGEASIFGSDAPPDRYQRPQGFSVSINLDDVAEAERVFAALAAGGEIQMALTETFWAARFGTLVDRFGTPWMINVAAKQS